MADVQCSAMKTSVTQSEEGGGDLRRVKAPGGFTGRPLRVLHGAGKRGAARRPWRSGTQEGRRSVGSTTGGPAWPAGLDRSARPEERKGKKEIYFEIDFQL
jgi:hypothetical protein